LLAMNISEFFIKIMILFIPGIIAYTIIDSLTEDTKKEFHYRASYSLILGFFSYMSFYFFLKLKYAEVDFSFFRTVVNQDGLNFIEIFFVSSYSILVGLLGSFLINYKVLHWIARGLKITRKFGDGNVWNYLMNSSEPTDWVVIRDREANLMYTGWVAAFSAANEKDELFIRDVDVYQNDTGNLLYNTPAVYLGCSKDSLIIEFPNINLEPQKSTFIMKIKEVISRVKRSFSRKPR